MRRDARRLRPRRRPCGLCVRRLENGCGHADAPLPPRPPRSSSCKPTCPPSSRHHSSSARSGACWSRPARFDDDLYSLNAAKLMMPGSAMKIVTVAAAAELLGWDHQFETKVVSVAPVDQGVLRGDLVVIGGGDPSISERSDAPGALSAIARQVRDAGIARDRRRRHRGRRPVRRQRVRRRLDARQPAVRLRGRRERARVQRRIASISSFGQEPPRAIPSPFRCGLTAADCRSTIDS